MRNKKKQTHFPQAGKKVRNDLSPSVISTFPPLSSRPTGEISLLFGSLIPIYCRATASTQRSLSAFGMTEWEGSGMTERKIRVDRKKVQDYKTDNRFGWEKILSSEF
jgi:hypothetical protein